MLNLCVVYQALNAKNALEEERRLIAELRPEYNLTMGGGGVKGLRFSPDARIKMSVSALKRWGVDVEKKAAAKAERQTRLHRKGSKITDVQLLARRREIIHTMQQMRCRPVRCVNDGLHFPSATAAAAHHGISTSSVVLYCQGRVKSRSGIAFEYDDGGVHVQSL